MFSLGGTLKLNQVDLELIDREILFLKSNNRIRPIVRCVLIGTLTLQIAPRKIEWPFEDTQIAV